MSLAALHSYSACPHPRTWRSHSPGGTDCPSWSNLAARPALSCLLDYYGHPLREFNKHERAITHLSALLTDRGITAKDAALCASILGGSSLLGRVVVGWLLDRFFGPHVALAVNFITALGVFLLAGAGSFVAGCLASALIAVGTGGEAATTPYLLTRYFGLQAFSTLLRTDMDILCRCRSNRASDIRRISPRDAPSKPTIFSVTSKNTLRETP